MSVSIRSYNVTLGDDNTGHPPSFDGRVTKPTSVWDQVSTAIGDGTIMETSTNGRHMYLAIVDPELTTRTRYSEGPGDVDITQVFQTHSQDGSANTESKYADGAKSVFSICVGTEDLTAKFAEVPYSDLEWNAVQFVKRHFESIYPDHHRHMKTLHSIERSTELARNIGASFMEHIIERKWHRPVKKVAAVVAVVEACRAECKEPFHAARASRYLGGAICASVSGLGYGKQGELLPESLTDIEALARWMINYISVWYNSMKVEHKIMITDSIEGKPQTKKEGVLPSQIHEDEPSMSAAQSASETTIDDQRSVSIIASLDGSRAPVPRKKLGLWKDSSQIFSTIQAISDEFFELAKVDTKGGGHGPKTDYLKSLRNQILRLITANDAQYLRQDDLDSREPFVHIRATNRTVQLLSAAMFSRLYVDPRDYYDPESPVDAHFITETVQHIRSKWQDMVRQSDGRHGPCQDMNTTMYYAERNLTKNYDESGGDWSDITTYVIREMSVSAEDVSSHDHPDKDTVLSVQTKDGELVGIKYRKEPNSSDVAPAIEFMADILSNEQPATAEMFWRLAKSSSIFQSGLGADRAVDPAWQREESGLVDQIVDKFFAAEDQRRSRARSRRPREQMTFTATIEGILKQLAEGLLGQEAREAWSVVTIAAAETWETRHKLIGAVIEVLVGCTIEVLTNNSRLKSLIVKVVLRIAELKLSVLPANYRIRVPHDHAMKNVNESPPARVHSDLITGSQAESRWQSMDHLAGEPPGKRIIATTCQDPCFGTKGSVVKD
ncbi:hypothetical protein FFLO_06533 [Filobasidium floriforme]|uniref:Uncharacterized protein n=1 Tax=Filobasidium floriforme TaxID=5210 RepID=A0A8K0NMS3_9TREE|nr:uncharacterized protein HD553DRAFT_325217 [Filobasidium floriforme]KAG7527888.1 hypothetical protein FFLO_06533 [Filobasidium floriforme]KAH8081731.1 hypothetical protein HD553DRAFT_325217 [Filobasidium floriforme]